MKKIILALLAVVFASTMCNAQLANTKWAGEMAVPTPTDIFLRFTADSAQIIIKDGGFVGESMLYTVKDSVITLKKVGGNSPCNIGDKFTIGYTIKDDKLWIKPMLDNCDERSGAWPADPFVKTDFK